MKVLHIGKYYPPFFGGVEKVNFDLVEGLYEKGCISDVLCFNHVKGNNFDTNKSQKIFRSAVLFKIAGQPISISFFKVYKKIRNNYKIIHLHLPNPLASIGVLIFKSKSKIILHWHNDIIKQKLLLFLYKPFQFLLLKKADAIFITSPQYVKGSPYLKNFENKCYVIPIGVSKNDIEVNENKLKIIKNKYKNKKIVFSVGRLSKYKGYEYLVKASINIQDNVIILIAGIGEEEKHLKNLICKNKIENKVHLLGKVPFNELGSYYELCDVFCMSSISKNEGFGIAQIEAMLFKKPIITTNIPGSGIAYGNIDKETGLVVPIKNSIALAEAITHLVNSKEMSLAFGENGYKRAIQTFSKDNMINKTFEIYLKLCEL